MFILYCHYLSFMNVYCTVYNYVNYTTQRQLDQRCCTPFDVYSKPIHKATHFNKTLHKGQRMSLSCPRWDSNQWCLQYESDAFTNWGTVGHRRFAKSICGSIEHLWPTYMLHVCVWPHNRGQDMRHLWLDLLDLMLQRCQWVSALKKPIDRTTPQHPVPRQLICRRPVTWYRRACSLLQPHPTNSFSVCPLVSSALLPSTRPYTEEHLECGMASCARHVRNKAPLPNQLDHVVIDHEFPSNVNISSPIPTRHSCNEA